MWHRFYKKDVLFFYHEAVSKRSFSFIPQAESLNLIQHEATPREKSQKKIHVSGGKFAKTVIFYKHEHDANFMSETVCPPAGG